MPDLAPTVIDTELTERLGQIVVRWSSLEYWISLLLATMLKADHGGMMVVTNNVAISVQTKWIRTLMSGHAHEAQHSQRVSRLLDRADELRSERNEFVHGIWQSGPEPRTALVETVNLERAEIIRSRLVTVQDLNELVVEIDHWIEDYVTLGRELGFPRRPGQTRSIFLD